MLLYRATNNKSDAKMPPVNSCWTDDQEAAKAYTDNPGFGGEFIVSANVTLGTWVDWTDDNGGTRAMIADLIEDEDEAYDLKQEWSGYQPFQVLENNTRLANLARQKYDWIVYTDDFPDGATTYRRMR